MNEIGQRGELFRFGLAQGDQCERRAKRAGIFFSSLNAFSDYRPIVE